MAMVEIFALARDVREALYRSESPDKAQEEMKKTTEAIYLTLLRRGKYISQMSVKSLDDLVRLHPDCLGTSYEAVMEALDQQAV